MTTTSDFSNYADVSRTTPTSAAKPIRAKDCATQRLLEAARDGNLEFLRQQLQLLGSSTSKSLWSNLTCTSGCTLLHWAAGANQIAVLDFLLTGSDPVSSLSTTPKKHQLTQPIFDSIDCPVEHRKAQGRTPLHYACRNGHLEATIWLIERQGGANPHVKAKHGVTPFQLAVWQNHLPVCQYLVDHCGVIAANEVNDFDCGPVHWLGIAPTERANCGIAGSEVTYTDGRDLLPLAQWLAAQPGMDFRKKQRQGHSALHKASWGGHLALVQYLHEAFDMMDDDPDRAGNYSASLADMAQTARHDQVAMYLRTKCSVERRKCCALLGIPVTAAKADVRRAYLQKAKELHPDKQEQQQLDVHVDNNMFQELHRAYQHLTNEEGRGTTQRNPSHSLHLMLQVAASKTGEANVNTNDSCFKAKLMAVLLEYGDKGMDLSNIKKKWNQVWGEQFPDVESNKLSSSQKKHASSLSEFLLEKAADVIRLERDPDNGKMTVFCKKCSQANVAGVQIADIPVGNS